MRVWRVVSESCGVVRDGLESCESFFRRVMKVVRFVSESYESFESCFREL